MAGCSSLPLFRRLLRLHTNRINTNSPHDTKTCNSASTSVIPCPETIDSTITPRTSCQNLCRLRSRRFLQVRRHSRMCNLFRLSYQTDSIDSIGAFRDRTSEFLRPSSISAPNPVWPLTPRSFGFFVLRLTLTYTCRTNGQLNLTCQFSTWFKYTIGLQRKCALRLTAGYHLQLGEEFFPWPQIYDNWVQLPSWHSTVHCSPYATLFLSWSLVHA